MNDYYKALGVDENASNDEIKKAYRKLSLLYHPDKNGGDDTKFKTINEAYQVLGDEKKRNEYNISKNNPFMMGNNADDLFKMFFGGAGPFGGLHEMGGFPMPQVQIFQNGRPINMNRMMKPPPIIKRIEIDIKDAYNGIKLPIQIERWIMFNNERRIEKEKIYIPINKGIDNGEIIIIRDKGNVRSESLKGDIKVFVNIKNNSEFTREGLNLILKKKITLKEALTGFKFDIKHLNGKTYAINNENGNVICSNYTKEIPGLGMMRDGAFGKLIIQFDVIFPEKLTLEQITKLKDIL